MSKPTRFNIATQPLYKAKPMLLQLIRDSGDVEWFQGCEAGQIYQIKTGRAKAYLDLAEVKIKNFNNALNVLQTAIRNKEKNAETDLAKFYAQHVELQNIKVQNMGPKGKPIYGWVHYEKEFTPYPHEPQIDSRRVTLWMDTIRKNFKDFQTQRLEAFGKVIVWILLGIGFVAFIVTRFGGGRGDVTQGVQQVAPVAQTVEVTGAYLLGVSKQWLRKWF